jgi:Flp pilus assembly protein TadB
MTILKDVFSELFSMFVSDARLTAAILAIVLATAALIDWADLPRLVGGAFLLAGCVAVLVLSVRREARARKSAQSPPAENG